MMTPKHWLLTWISYRYCTTNFQNKFDTHFTSVVMTKALALGLMVTSPVIRPTSWNSSYNSRYFWLLRAFREKTRVTSFYHDNLRNLRNCPHQYFFVLTAYNKCSSKNNKPVDNPWYSKFKCTCMSQ